MVIEMLPTKSKVMRTLRKVFPQARFHREGTTIALRYKPPGQPAEVDVCHVEIGPGNERGAQIALMTAAFRHYGFDPVWVAQLQQFEFRQLAGYTGPEDLLPVEFDPDVDPAGVQ